MICYRDQTFCTAFGERCGNALCHRALTDEVRADASRWWGNEGAPIAVADLWDGCEFREAASGVISDTPASNSSVRTHS